MDDEWGTREQRLPLAGGNGLPRHSQRRPGPPAGADWEGSGTGTSRRAGPPAGPRRVKGKRRKNRSWWVELPLLVIFALILALLIKTFIVQAFYIPSASMEDTLLIGDKVLVNKLVYDFRPVHRGDIVVFNGEGSWDPAPFAQPSPFERLWDSITGLFGTAPGVHDYIKRVIGVPGDHVACCNAHGQVTVNGVPLTESSYLYPGDTPSATSFHATVPQGQLWVMGDHRSVSYDSRGHMGDPGGGTIPEDKVVGRAFVIVWPVSRWRVLSIPATFQQPRLAAARSPGAGTGPVAAALNGPGIPVQPGAPLTPLALGFAGAVPLTLLQRRLRRPAARRLARGWRVTRSRATRALARSRGAAGPRRGPAGPGPDLGGRGEGLAGQGQDPSGPGRGPCGPPGPGRR